MCLILLVLPVHSTRGISDLDCDRGLGDTSTQARQNWFLGSRNGNEDWKLQMEDKASASQKMLLRWRKKHADICLWALNQLVALYWPVLTKLSWPEVRSLRSKPGAIDLLQIGFQNVPTETPAGKSSRVIGKMESAVICSAGVSAGSQEEVTSNWRTRKWWTPEAPQLEEERTMPCLWVTLGKKRPAIGARLLTWIILLKIVQHYPYTRRVQWRR